MPFKGIPYFLETLARQVRPGWGPYKKMGRRFGEYCQKARREKKDWPFRGDENRKAIFLAEEITAVYLVALWQGDLDGVREWFEEHFPDVAKLIPSQRWGSFVDAITEEMGSWWWDTQWSEKAHDRHMWIVQTLIAQSEEGAFCLGDLAPALRISNREARTLIQRWREGGIIESCGKVLRQDTAGTKRRVPAYKIIQGPDKEEET